MSKKLAALGAAIAAWALVTVPAGAADLDTTLLRAPELPMTKPVEIGSGWYLRGDVGYNFGDNYANSDATTIDPTLRTGLSDSDKNTPITGSIGVGYHFNDFLRADVDFGILQMDKSKLGYEGGCIGTQTVTTGGTVVSSGASSRGCAARLTTKDDVMLGLVNGYVDLGTYAGITPYIGAGVGFAYSKLKVSNSASCLGEQTVAGATTTTFVCDGASGYDAGPVNYAGDSFDKDQFSFAYALNAGFAYQLTRNLSLDLSYRYVNAPKAEYARIDDDELHIGKGLHFNEVRAGLRYDIW